MRGRMIALVAGLSLAAAGGALAASGPVVPASGLIKIAKTSHHHARHHKGGKKMKTGQASSSTPAK